MRYRLYPVVCLSQYGRPTDTCFSLDLDPILCAQVQCEQEQERAAGATIDGVNMMDLLNEIVGEEEEKPQGERNRDTVEPTAHGCSML